MAKKVRWKDLAGVKGAKPALSIPGGKKSKYNNIKSVSDGIKFDSKREEARYYELLLLKRAGKIKDLEPHPSFKLCKGVKYSDASRAKPALRYTADFAYTIVKTGERVVEDVKSEATQENTAYKIRRHLMLALLGIEVQEVL